jgi:hypothetical protein
MYWLSEFAVVGRSVNKKRRRRRARGVYIALGYRPKALAPRQIPGRTLSGGEKV